MYLIIYYDKYHQGVFICAFELFMLAYSNLDVHTTRMLLINIFSTVNLQDMLRLLSYFKLFI